MFIQAIIGHTENEKALRERFDTWVRDQAPQAEGWQGTTAGITDDGEFVAAVRFESEEAARRNSERPEQGEWWQATEPLFDGPVRFVDLPHTETFVDGGSDDAGFVQIIRSRTSDIDRLRQASVDMDDQMPTMRPDVIGGTYAWNDDGEVVQTVYFPSEEEAREGERLMEDASDEMQATYEEYLSLQSELEYYDLRDPWLHSAV